MLLKKSFGKGSELVIISFARFDSGKCWFREQQRFNSILDQVNYTQENKVLATQRRESYDLFYNIHAFAVMQ